MSKLEDYTEGPWYAGKLCYDGYGSGYISIGEFNKEEHFEDTICQVFDGNHIAEDNARIIVASPDMYEALLEAKEVLDSLGLSLDSVNKAIEKVKTYEQKIAKEN